MAERPLDVLDADRVVADEGLGDVLVQLDLARAARGLAEALTADVSDIESVLAVAYAAEQAAIRQLFVDFLIHLPVEAGAALARACLVAIALDQACERFRQRSLTV